MLRGVRLLVSSERVNHDSLCFDDAAHKFMIQDFFFFLKKSVVTQLDRNFRDFI